MNPPVSARGFLDLFFFLVFPPGAAFGKRFRGDAGLTGDAEAPSAKRVKQLTP
jgi:hypothetical protein